MNEAIKATIGLYYIPVLVFFLAYVLVEAIGFFEGDLFGKKKNKGDDVEKNNKDVRRKEDK